MKKYIFLFPFITSCNGLIKSAINGTDSLAYHGDYNVSRSLVFSRLSLKETCLHRIRSYYDQLILGSNNPGKMALDIYQYIKKGQKLIFYPNEAIKNAALEAALKQAEEIWNQGDRIYDSGKEERSDCYDSIIFGCPSTLIIKPVQESLLIPTAIFQNALLTNPEYEELFKVISPFMEFDQSRTSLSL
ncbi:MULTISPECIES: hypothetical protein [Candidatus Cardinium]|uniref:hypothetical protein n=1 Tax=Candidatus Cardinium TaxID=273135 RepID=UPI001FA9C74D|nr:MULTISPECIES: hypothetical protein [Cardinium]